MAELPRRVVIREHHFERELERLQLGRARETDAFVEAAEYVLARDPELGLRIADDSLVWALL